MTVNGPGSLQPDGLFVKLMMMTTSPNDAEALIALRKANRILSEAKVNWAELLAATRQPNEVPRQSERRRPEPEWKNVGDERHDDADEIDSLFERAFAQKMSEGFEEFLCSVRMWWERRGFLTERQYRAVKRAASRKDY
jgi:hypothetical protein